MTRPRTPQRKIRLFYRATGTAALTILTNRNNDDDKIPFSVLIGVYPPEALLAPFWAGGCSKRPFASPCLLFCS
jgi:hypothetical protein